MVTTTLGVALLFLSAYVFKEMSVDGGFCGCFCYFGKQLELFVATTGRVMELFWEVQAYVCRCELVTGADY